MKKVQVLWNETHSYSAEIEIPDNLSKEEELDWVMDNTDDWATVAEPDDINTEWDTFYIEEIQ